MLLPNPVAAEVDGLRRAVGDRSLGRVPPHLTLVPPVNVPEARLGDALAVLRSAASATAPVRVRLGPPASFLPHTPVLYLGVSEGEDAVNSLRERVFHEPLARPLSWPYIPHVTLAESLARERLTAAISALADYRVDVTFDRLHLLEEQAGRVWVQLADAVFTPAVVVGRGGLPLDITVTGSPDPEAQAFARTEWPAQWVRDLGADPGTDRRAFAITARREGEVVGLAEGWTAGGVACLSRLIVAQVHRGSGVGSRLLAAFESLAAERQCPRLSARVPAEGPAERFYSHRGWVSEGRLSPWLYGRDFVQMRRDL
jgi:2'-5' RNA ligase